MQHNCPPQLIILTLAAVIALNGCTPRGLLLGSGAAVGTAAMQERGLDGAASDMSLRLAINDAWFKASLDLYQRAKLMISKGTVVITGRMPDEAMRQRAASLARSAGAREIINELTVGPDLPFGVTMKDNLIGGELRASLTFDRDVSAINYAIAVDDGVVMLAGIARSESELRRVTLTASRIDGVKLVKSFVHLPESAYTDTVSGGPS